MPGDAEFDRLINLYLEGMLTERDQRAFEQQILQDDGCVDRLAQWCLTHRQLLDLETEGQLHQLMDQFVTALPGPPRAAIAARSGTIGVDRRLVPTARSKRRWAKQDNVKRRLTSWAIAAAAVAVVLAVAMLAIFARHAPWLNLDFARGPGRPDSPAVNYLERQAIASLTRLVKPVWAADATAIQLGSPLRRGERVRLESGLAKVTFHCGAEVALEGPCDFEIHDDMIGVLQQGKATVDVPRRAFAFAILCPGVELVDLGTSFGVSVDHQGQTELHVFEGEVLCNRALPTPPLPSQTGATPGIHVRARSAVEFRPREDDASDIAINEAQFSGLRSMRRGANQGHLGVTPENLALWLAADTAVVTDEQGRVPCWPDIIFGQNVSAEDAVQAKETARPLLVPSAVHGRPAIRFDGHSDYLLTTPLETTDDQTVLLVCQFSPAAFDQERIWGGQILNYDGPPNRYLSTTLEPGVLQIGEPLLAHEFQPSLLTAQVFAGFIGSATVEAGRIDAEQVGADAPVVLAYRYDFGNQVAELWVNGRSYGSARAFAPQEITSRKIIGRHAWKQLYFYGDLAELLIYNSALSAAELSETTSYLANKYAIEVLSEMASSAGNQQ